MQSVAESLRRFVDPDAGPVTSVTSAPYPSFWRRVMWHSISPLHERWVPQDGRPQVFKYAGGGWSRDREESQCKAVTEGVERWALRYFTLNSPSVAGLDSDPTSNGFAALPSSYPAGRLIGNAYCEALERWALAHLWDQGDFPVREAPPANSVASVLLPDSLGKPRFFEAVLKPQSANLAGADRVYFALCLLRTANGGVLPGSACGEDPVRAQEHAICEARIHVNAFNRMKGMSGVELKNLTERRLRHFAENPEGFNLVSRRLAISEAPPALEAPAAAFSRRLPGEWDPEISVHRVMVAQPRHLHEGGLERFII